MAIDFEYLSVDDKIIITNDPKKFTRMVIEEKKKVGETFLTKISRSLNSKMRVIDNQDVLFYIDLPNKSRRAKIKHLFIKRGIVKESKYYKKSILDYKMNAVYCWLDNQEDYRQKRISGVVDYYKLIMFKYVENNKDKAHIANNYQYLISHLIR